VSPAERLRTVAVYCSIIAGCFAVVGLVIFALSKTAREEIRKAANTREKKVLFLFMGFVVLSTIIGAAYNALKLMLPH
jgi:hypothetical protein